MTRAVAIAQEDSVKVAIDSAINSAKALADFMYGTPERSRMTVVFALGMVALGNFISLSHSLMGYCS